MGKLIVIEGLDGSGKSTQLKMLADRLSLDGTDYECVSFPNYNSPACEPVKMYLRGDFGQNVGDVNAYTASSFYAIDRFASYKTSWGEFYNNGGIVICGRYTTSNVVHQCSKLPKEKWEEFSRWLFDYEYNLLKIPKPDLTVFLSMSEEMSDNLLKHRYSGDESKKDIHEKDREYQKVCREAAEFAADFDGWVKVNCEDKGTLRQREDISDEIYAIVKKVIGDNK